MAQYVWKSRDGSHGKLANRRQNPAYKTWYDAGQRTAADNEAAKERGYKPGSYDWHKFINARKQQRRDALGGRPAPWLDTQPDGTERPAGGTGKTPTPTKIQQPTASATGLTTPLVPKVTKVEVPTVKMPTSRVVAPERPASLDAALPSASERLTGLLASDSPYLARARTRGLQHANRRGLLSSSIAAGASEAAAIDAAAPIALADADLALRERDQVSREYTRERELYTQRAMQEYGLEVDAAQRHADRVLAVGEAAAHREFVAIQSALDREAGQIAQTRQLSHDAAMSEASRALQSRIARDTAIRDINANYSRWTTALSLNTDIPVEERRAMEEHYAWVRDESMRAIQQLYNYVPVWTSGRRPVEEA